MNKIGICDGVYSDIDEDMKALVSGMFDQPVELEFTPVWKSRMEV